MVDRERSVQASIQMDEVLEENDELASRVVELEKLYAELRNYAIDIESKLEQTEDEPETTKRTLHSELRDGGRFQKRRTLTDPVFRRGSLCSKGSRSRSNSAESRDFMARRGSLPLIKANSDGPVIRIEDRMWKTASDRRKSWAVPSMPWAASPAEQAKLNAQLRSAAVHIKTAEEDRSALEAAHNEDRRVIASLESQLAEAQKEIQIIRERDDEQIKVLKDQIADLHEMQMEAELSEGGSSPMRRTMSLGLELSARLSVCSQGSEGGRSPLAERIMGKLFSNESSPSSEVFSQSIVAAMEEERGQLNAKLSAVLAENSVLLSAKQQLSHDYDELRELFAHQEEAQMAAAAGKGKDYEERVKLQSRLVSLLADFSKQNQEKQELSAKLTTALAECSALREQLGGSRPCSQARVSSRRTSAGGTSMEVEATPRSGSIDLGSKASMETFGALPQVQGPALQCATPPRASVDASASLEAIQELGDRGSGGTGELASDHQCEHETEKLREQLSTVRLENHELRQRLDKLEEEENTTDDQVQSWDSSAVLGDSMREKEAKLRVLEVCASIPASRPSIRSCASTNHICCDHTLMACELAQDLLRECERLRDRAAGGGDQHLAMAKRELTKLHDEQGNEDSTSRRASKSPSESDNGGSGGGSDGSVPLRILGDRLQAKLDGGKGKWVRFQGSRSSSPVSPGFEVSSVADDGSGQAFALEQQALVAQIAGLQRELRRSRRESAEWREQARIASMPWWKGWMCSGENRSTPVPVASETSPVRLEGGRQQGPGSPGSPGGECPSDLDARDSEVLRWKTQRSPSVTS